MTNEKSRNVTKSGTYATVSNRSTVKVLCGTHEAFSNACIDCGEEQTWAVVEASRKANIPLRCVDCAADASGEV